MAVDITVDDLTTGSVTGTGAYDRLMATVSAQLESQFKQNRINSSDFAKIYTQAIQYALQAAVQFELGREAAAAQAELLIAQKGLVTQQELNAVKEGENTDADTANKQQQLINLTSENLRIKALTAQVEAETLNVPKQGLLLDAQKIDVEASTSLKAQQESNLAKEALNIPKQGQVLDAQVLNLGSEKLRIDAQTDQIEAEVLNIPKQGALIDAQTDVQAQQKLNLVTEERKATEEVKLVTQNTANALAQNAVLTAQAAKVREEENLLGEKVKTEQAQTNGYGVDVDSVIGRQKALYLAQTDGFKRDAEQKAAKIVADAYNVRKSADSSASTPVGLEDTSITEVVNVMKSGIGI